MASDGASRREERRKPRGTDEEATVATADLATAAAAAAYLLNRMNTQRDRTLLTRSFGFRQRRRRRPRVRDAECDGIHET